MKIILMPERSIESVEICRQLREQARKECCGYSNTVDRLEWIAANIIEQLILELEEKERDIDTAKKNIGNMVMSNDGGKVLGEKDGKSE